MVKIFVGNLDEGSDAVKLREMFEMYGEVRECDVLSKYGFVHMTDESAAQSAIAALNGTDLDGVQIDVKMSTSSGRGGSGRGGSRVRVLGRGGFRDGNGFGGRRLSARDMGPGPVKIFIGNMAEETKTEDVQKLFERYGEITECAVLNRYGFVHMANPDDADAAIEALHHSKLHDFTINVELSHGKSKNRDDDRGPRFGMGMRGGRGASRGSRGNSRFDPYSRDGYSSDPYDRAPLPPAYDRDPYPRLPPPPPRERDPYDPYRRADPYARDPYDDPYRRPAPRDPYLDRDLYDAYRRDPYLYARPRDPYPPRERDPYSRDRDPYSAAPRERDPYARPPPAYYDYDNARRPVVDEPKYDPYTAASRRPVAPTTTTDPYAQHSSVSAVPSSIFSSGNGY